MYLFCCFGVCGGYGEEGEVVEVLGVDRHTVVKWIKEGKIRAIRLPSGRYRIHESEVKNT